MVFSISRSATPMGSPGPGVLSRNAPASSEMRPASCRAWIRSSGLSLYSPGSRELGRSSAICSLERSDPVSVHSNVEAVEAQAITLL